MNTQHTNTQHTTHKHTTHTQTLFWLYNRTQKKKFVMNARLHAREHSVSVWTGQPNLKRQKKKKRVKANQISQSDAHSSKERETY